MRLEVVRATALAHAVVSRCRALYMNQISTITNGTFAGLTALTELYGAGLWAGLSSLLAAWCLHGSEAPRGLLQNCYSLHGHFSSPLAFFSHSLTYTYSHTLDSRDQRFIAVFVRARCVWWIE